VKDGEKLTLLMEIQLQLHIKEAAVCITAVCKSSDLKKKKSMQTRQIKFNFIMEMKVITEVTAGWMISSLSRGIK